MRVKVGTYRIGASLAAQTVKNLPWIEETRVRSLHQEDAPTEGKGNPFHYSYHGQRSMVGSSPWGLKESDITAISMPEGIKIVG